MTIGVAVRIQSAVVFATDSKLTTRGVAGIADDGSISWTDQSYDNATKVAHDRRKCVMALVAGNAHLGPTTADDFIASYAFPECATEDDEEPAVITLLDTMNEHRRTYWAVEEHQMKQPQRFDLLAEIQNGTVARRKLFEMGKLPIGKTVWSDESTKELEQIISAPAPEWFRRAQRLASK